MYVPKQLSNLSVWVLDSKCRGLFPRVSLLVDEQLAQLALKGVKEETTGPHHRSLCLGTMAEVCTCNPTHGTVIKGSLKELPCYGYL